MNCPWVPRIVEGARTAVRPTAEVRQHLAECQHCERRWAQEALVSERLRSIRQASAAERSSVEARRLVMERFAATPRRTIAIPKLWLALAASLLIGFVLQNTWSHRQSTDSLDTDWSAEGFVPVPFVPPLASGEFVKVIHANLQPSDFARMGIDLDTASANLIPADVLLGEDDSPRAVRVSGEELNF